MVISTRPTVVDHGYIYKTHRGRPWLYLGDPLWSTMVICTRPTVVDDSCVYERYCYQLQMWLRDALWSTMIIFIYHLWEALCSTKIILMKRNVVHHDLYFWDVLWSTISISMRRTVIHEDYRFLWDALLPDIVVCTSRTMFNHSCVY